MSGWVEYSTYCDLKCNRSAATPPLNCDVLVVIPITHCWDTIALKSNHFYSKFE